MLCLYYSDLLKKDSLYVQGSVFNNASFQQITPGADNSKPYDPMGNFVKNQWANQIMK